MTEDQDPATEPRPATDRPAPQGNPGRPVFSGSDTAHQPVARHGRPVTPAFGTAAAATPPAQQPAADLPLGDPPARDPFATEARPHHIAWRSPSPEQD